jgi:hypothetical protein
MRTTAATCAQASPMQKRSPSPRVSSGAVGCARRGFWYNRPAVKPGSPMAANDETAPATAAKFFDEPKREVDDDRLDVYERARDALNELKAALPSATDDIERLLGQIKRGVLGSLWRSGKRCDTGPLADAETGAMTWKPKQRSSPASQAVAVPSSSPHSPSKRL